MSEFIQKYKASYLNLNKKYYKDFQDFIVKNIKNSNVKWLNINFLPITQDNKKTAESLELKNNSTMAVFLLSADHTGNINVLDAENVNKKIDTEKYGLTLEDVKLINLLKKELKNNFSEYANIFNSNSNKMTVSIVFKEQHKFSF